MRHCDRLGLVCLLDFGIDVFMKKVYDVRWFKFSLLSSIAAGLFKFILKAAMDSYPIDPYTIDDISTKVITDVNIS